MALHLQLELINRRIARRELAETVCTVTTFAGDDSIVITMNRDERRQRPEQGLFQNKQVAYPVDSDSGGTWCGINSSGIALTLLNRYQDVTVRDEDKPRFSRGGIIPSLLQAETACMAIAVLREFDLAQFDAFTLLVLSRDQCSECIWNGRNLSVSDWSSRPWNMATSTSIRPAEILQMRNRRFSVWAQNAAAEFGTIPCLHLDQSGWDKSEAIMMQRALSHTKSICQIVLQPGAARLLYFNLHSLPGLIDNPSMIPPASATFC